MNALEMRGEQHRRFFWRVRHRIGARWWLMDKAAAASEMRRLSWRRAL